MRYNQPQWPGGLAGTRQSRARPAAADRRPRPPRPHPPPSLPSPFGARRRGRARRADAGQARFQPRPDPDCTTEMLSTPRVAVTPCHASFGRSCAAAAAVSRRCAPPFSLPRPKTGGPGWESPHLVKLGHNQWARRPAPRATPFRGGWPLRSVLSPVTRRREGGGKNSEPPAARGVRSGPRVAHRASSQPAGLLSRLAPVSRGTRNP